MTSLAKTALLLSLCAPFGQVALATPARLPHSSSSSSSSSSSGGSGGGGAHLKEAVAARAAISSICTTGQPASRQHPAGFPINDFIVVSPADAGWTSYAVESEWYAEHFVSGPHIMPFTHKSDPYGPFKCQYTCNAAEGCNAYFVWYENVGTDDEHLNCVLFDAVIPPSVFVETNGTIATGAYDRLCNHSA